MTFDDLVAETQTISDRNAEIDRNGRVNVAGWDEYGDPIGGQLTYYALGAVNEAEYDLCTIGACGGCRFCR